MNDEKSNVNRLRRPPQDVDAEKALLGSILLRPQNIHEVIDLVRAESFYVRKHQEIFRIMIDLYNNGSAIDHVTVGAKIKELNLEKAVGGLAYLAELTDSSPSSANMEFYAKLVRNKYNRRNLIETGAYISDMAFDEREEVETIMDTAEKKIFEITQNENDGRFVGIKQIIPEVWSNIERLHESQGGLRGVPTGFSSLDKILSGLQPADLIILAARPSVGKTSLALNIALNAAVRHEVSVGVFSLEMSKTQLVDRLMSSQSGVDSWKMRTGQGLTEDDFIKMRDAMDVLARSNIFIDDRAAAQIMQMRSVARRLKAEQGLGLIVVDYMQLMSTSRNHDSMVNQVTEISKSLKALARELNVPVLALSQLSRAVESRGGKPRLSDLRDSGSIEQDADVVMFIHREDRNREDQSENNNIAEIIIAKHRNGATGNIELYFENSRTTFTEIDNAHGYGQMISSNSGDDFDSF